jgi:predicted porin
VAGLVSGAAYAQTNVTVYGRADLGYTYGKSDYKKFQGVENGKGIGGGGSRIGLQGEEGLGNGLKAIFKFEWGANIDVGGGPVGERYTYVGLAGNFGTLTVGRNGTPSDLWLGATGVYGTNGYEPMALFRPKLGYSGSYKDEKGDTKYYNENSHGVIDGVRWNNSISYTSPKFSGLDFMAIYSFGEKVKSKKVDKQDTSDAGKLGLGVRYANGPLYLAAAYQAHNDDADAWGAKGWGIGGSYDFKVAKVYANYYRAKANHNGLAAWAEEAVYDEYGVVVDAGSDKQTTWSIGVGVPVSSAGTVSFEYAQYKDYGDVYGVTRDVVDLADVAGVSIGGSGNKAKGYTAGYRHNLSKRTWLYTYVTRIDNDRGINAGWSKASVIGKDQTIFTGGIVHLF